jgi:hypothetical protein
VIEPYLFQQALVTRRRATKPAYEHLGLKWSPKSEGEASEGLFE